MIYCFWLLCCRIESASVAKSDRHSKAIETYEECCKERRLYGAIKSAQFLKIVFFTFFYGAFLQFLQKTSREIGLRGKKILGSYVISGFTKESRIGT